MKSVEIIRKLKASTFKDEDGEPYTVDFKPGLTEAELDTLRERFPSNIIADELQEILRETRGWEGPYGSEIYFDSIGEFGFTELIPQSITLAGNGLGDLWVLDIKENGDLGKIYFACHDPAVLVIYCDTLQEFFETLEEHYNNPGDSYFINIHENVVWDIWSTHPNTVEIADFRKGNEELAPFLREFTDDEWIVADLRRGTRKSGFAWGKFGPNQFTRRHPRALVWVIQKKKKGFLSKLFGK
ncbi:SMI1/KNR4 family protein [Dawidia soli]|uniref:Knr4/Smi1-like domain-containing protein n=1 Tax=Dawidia soli TaxID=2782352 RepID=A0AAP2GIS9_9BACT|nr:SMI1/KNR4 family protein [Dawidia soli]MBT1688656.1 hypothetical protein [Dawidia soli]